MFICSMSGAPVVNPRRHEEDMKTAQRKKKPTQLKTSSFFLGGCRFSIKLVTFQIKCLHTEHMISL